MQHEQIIRRMPRAQTNWNLERRVYKNLIKMHKLV